MGPAKQMALGRSGPLRLSELHYPREGRLHNAWLPLNAGGLIQSGSISRVIVLSGRALWPVSSDEAGLWQRRSEMAIRRSECDQRRHTGTVTLNWSHGTSPTLPIMGLVLLKDKIIKIHSFPNMAYDWLASLLPANQKPGLNILIHSTWILHGSI